jgi:hypothetical protein
MTILTKITTSNRSGARAFDERAGRGSALHSRAPEVHTRVSLVLIGLILTEKKIVWTRPQAEKFKV